MYLEVQPIISVGFPSFHLLTWFLSVYLFFWSLISKSQEFSIWIMEGVGTTHTTGHIFFFFDRWPKMDDEEMYSLANFVSLHMRAHGNFMNVHLLQPISSTSSFHLHFHSPCGEKSPNEELLLNGVKASLSLHPRLCVLLGESQTDKSASCLKSQTQRTGGFVYFLPFDLQNCTL